MRPVLASSGAISWISCSMRPARWAVSSWTKVSVGVRFMRSSRATCACSSPRDGAQAGDRLVRSSGSPSTLTNTRAALRSGLVSTEVTVTNPMRGSFRSPAMCDERTSLIASFTRRILGGAILEHS